MAESMTEAPATGLSAMAHGTADDLAAVAAALQEAAKSPERRAVEAGDRANVATLQRLYAQYGATVDPTAMHMVRLQVLLDFVLGDLDSEPRQQYEALYNATLAQQLADLESQLVQAKLVAGTPAQASAGGGLIIPGR